MRDVTKRPATATDLELIYKIVRESLARYIEQTWGPWNESDQRARFAATTHADDHLILEIDGQPVGCMSVKASESEIYLARLLLLPEFQNRGFGSALIREVIEPADARRVPVHLRVMKVNPARRLYERFGFAVTGETETHYMMVRPARER